MKQKISAIIIGLLFATNVLAVEIIPLPEFTAQESFIQKIWRCKFSIACYREPRLGVSVTEISGSTLISAYPTIQNANVNALNDGKIENSTTSVAAITTLSNLVTVGTLTSGSLGSGFTTVVVGRGGTGSTTLSANQVLLGNGTGNIGVVVGWGLLGQGLLSNGGTLAPTWQAITTDQTANYIWSGTHTFNNRAVFGSSINATGTALIQQLNASSTAANPIVLNGVSLNTPSVQGASSTVLKNNGSGSLIWDFPGLTATSVSTILATSSHRLLGANSVAKQTMGSTTIAGNTLKTDGYIEFWAKTHYLNSAGGGSLTITVDYGSCTISAPAIAAVTTNANGLVGEIRAILSARNSTQSQIISILWQSAEIRSSGTAINAQSIGTDTEQTCAIDSTAAQDFAVRFQHGTANASSYMEITQPRFIQYR